MQVAVQDRCHTVAVVQQLCQALAQRINLRGDKKKRTSVSLALHEPRSYQQLRSLTSPEKRLKPCVRSSSAQSASCCWKNDCAPSAGSSYGTAARHDVMQLLAAHVVLYPPT
jgi:hypothetical protein